MRARKMHLAFGFEIDGSLSLLQHRIDLEERPRIFSYFS